MSQDYDSDFERGLANRRRMLGDAWVDQSIGQANSFNAEFQNFITRYAWHEIWSRPGLPAKTRRIIVLSITTALGRWEEFELHARAALQGGPEDHLTPDELREVLLQAAIYAGVPAANSAMSHALKILRELGYELPPADATSVSVEARGRVGRTSSRPTIHYNVREARSGSARHTIVLSHALGFDSSMWDALARSLSAEHRVIWYDHRGHGVSESPPGSYTMQDIAEDAERMLAELDAGPVVWIGLSLGGMAGQELALRHPSRVKAIISANSCAEYPEAGKKMLRERAAYVRANGMAEAADAVLQRCFSEAYFKAHSGTIAGFRRRMLANLPDGYAACCEAVAGHNTGGRIASLKVPLLAIASPLDLATPPELARDLVAQVKGAALTMLPDVGHFSVIEAPAAFEAEVRRFLRPLPVSTYM